MSDVAFAQIDPSVNGSKTGWRTVRFGDVVRNVDSSVRNPLEQGIERFVGLEHLDPESLHVKRWGNVADGTSFTRKFSSGQVLFGKRRAYQRKAAVADFDGICSGDILVFEPKSDELLPELLPFIVQSDGFFEHALGTSAGSLSPRTKWSDMARYEFALPPKEEQRRIAEILWAVDSVLEKWTFALKEINTVFKGFSSQIFENIFNLESLAINVKSKKIKRLIDVATLQRGHDLPTQQRKEGTIPIIGSNGIVGTHNKAMYKSPGVMTGRSGTIGSVYFVEENYHPLNTVLFVKDFHGNNPRFIYFLLQNIGLEKYSTGSAVPTLNRNNLHPIEISVPELIEQDEIVKTLDSCLSGKVEVEKHIAVTKELKSNLLKKYV